MGRVGGGIPRAGKSLLAGWLPAATPAIGWAGLPPVKVGWGFMNRPALVFFFVRLFLFHYVTQSIYCSFQTNHTQTGQKDCRLFPPDLFLYLSPIFRGLHTTSFPLLFTHTRLVYHHSYSLVLYSSRHTLFFFCLYTLFLCVALHSLFLYFHFFWSVATCVSAILIFPPPAVVTLCFVNLSRDIAPAKCVPFGPTIWFLIFGAKQRPFSIVRSPQPSCWLARATSVSLCHWPPSSGSGLTPSRRIRQHFPPDFRV